MAKTVIRVPSIACVRIEIEAELVEVAVDGDRVGNQVRIVVAGLRQAVGGVGRQCSDNRRFGIFERRGVVAFPCIHVEVAVAISVVFASDYDGVSSDEHAVIGEGDV